MVIFEKPISSASLLSALLMTDLLHSVNKMKLSYSHHCLSSNFIFIDLYRLYERERGVHKDYPFTSPSLERIEGLML